MKNTKRSVAKVIYIIILVFASIITIYPLLYTVSIAFSPNPSAMSASIIPFADGFISDSAKLPDCIAWCMIDAKVASNV